MPKESNPFKGNGRRPQFEVNGRRPQFQGEWKTTLFFWKMGENHNILAKWNTTSIVWQNTLRLFFILSLPAVILTKYSQFDTPTGGRLQNVIVRLTQPS